jgi:hypothetical protein
MNDTRDEMVPAHPNVPLSGISVGITQYETDVIKPDNSVWLVNTPTAPTITKFGLGFRQKPVGAYTCSIATPYPEIKTVTEDAMESDADDTPNAESSVGAGHRSGLRMM